MRPHGLQPTRLPCPWDSPGKNTGVVAMPSSRELPQRDLSQFSHIEADSLPSEPPGKTHSKDVLIYYYVTFRKTALLKRYMHLNVHCNTIYNVQDMETTYMSTDRWMDTEDVVYVYTIKCYSAIKERNNTICRNMDGPRDYHTKWSQPDRKRPISYSTNYM